MRRNKYSKVLAYEHGMGHIFRRDAVLLADANGKRQEAEEIRARTEHHADWHCEDAHDDMEIWSKEGRNEHDERLCHSIHHFGTREHTEKYTGSQQDHRHAERFTGMRLDAL